MSAPTQKYVAFLRGINVGGHRKLPMADLKKEMAALGFVRVETLLNSGNVIFEGPVAEEKALEEKISDHLEKLFQFPVPVLLRKAEEVLVLYEHNPFRNISVTKDTRLYVSFLAEQPDIKENLSSLSREKAFEIVEINNRTVCSVLDLSQGKTVKAMGILEQHFGKNITTRNWKTIEKIATKLL